VSGAAALAAAAAASTSPTAATASFAQQLGARLTNLGGLGQGTHVLSVPINPEQLGPVRVVARIEGDHVRIELHGATDQIRDALRDSMGQLRRDLADSGLRAELELGTGSGGRSDPRESADGVARSSSGPDSSDADGSGISTGSTNGGRMSAHDLGAATSTALRSGRIDVVV
jgi:flagellar hook-length control protein FliK